MASREGVAEPGAPLLDLGQPARGVTQRLRAGRGAASRHPLLFGGADTAVRGARENWDPALGPSPNFRTRAWLERFWSLGNLRESAQGPSFLLRESAQGPSFLQARCCAAGPRSSRGTCSGGGVKAGAFPSRGRGKRGDCSCHKVLATSEAAWTGQGPWQ